MLEGHGGSEAGGQQRTTDGDGLQSSVHHLVTVAGAAALVEVGHVVATGEGGVGGLLLEELAQGSPAVVVVVLQETLLGDEGADLGHVLVVHLLTLVGEITTEEGLEELVQHGVVHAGGPAEVRHKLVLRVTDTPVDGLHDGGVPRVDVAGGQDDLGVGIGLNQLLGESTGGPVAHGLAVTQKLVPFLAAELADTVVLGVEGVVPHQAVGRVLNTGTHHVVALGVAETLQGLAEGWKESIPAFNGRISAWTISLTGSAGAANTEGQHLHGHGAVALPTVNACVIGEDIRLGLRSQVVGEWERHRGRVMSSL